MDTDSSLVVKDNGQVMQIVTLDKAQIESHYDMLYHVELTADKEQIGTDDIDTATVTAIVKDYLGTVQTDYSGLIHFILDGHKIDQAAVSGMTQLLITSDHDNEIKLIAWIDDKCRAGELSIHAEKAYFA